MLYNNALRDYNGGNNDLATQEFNDYVKFYPNTDLAGKLLLLSGRNSVQGGRLSESGRRATIWCCKIFPAGNKAASAQLKKGLALIELGNRKTESPN